MTTTKNTDDKSTNAAPAELHPRIGDALIMAAANREQKEELARMVVDALSTEKLADTLRECSRGEAAALLALLSPERRRAVLREAGFATLGRAQ